MNGDNDSARYVGDFDARGVARIWHVEDGYQRELARVVDASPAGLAWGYVGCGPADTSRTILTDAVGNRGLAERLYADFQEQVVDRLPINQRFELPVGDVNSWLVDHGVTPPGIEPARDSRPMPVDDADVFAWAQELEQRERNLQRWAEQLVEREQAVVRVEQRLRAEQSAWIGRDHVEPAWSLPASPVAQEIRAIMNDTGDGISQVAKFLGVDHEWVADVLAGRVSDIDLPHIQQLCESLHCTPHDFWGIEAGRSIAHAYPPELWPRYIEPLDAWPPNPGDVIPDRRPPEPPAPGMEL